MSHSADKRRQMPELLLKSGWFALHTSAAMIVSPMIVLMGVAVVSSSTLRWITEGGGLGNPLIWGPGFALGLLVNQKTLQHIACWVWLVGVAWLAAGIWDSINSYDARFYQGCSALENVVNGFFILNSHRCGGGSSTLEGLIFTIPALSSVAYSIGAWVPILRQRRDEST